MIGIVDYGMGNLYSVSKALERLGAEPELVDRPERLRQADKLILPGVGAFGDAMEELRTRDLIDPIREYVKSRKPLLGVCLGLQLLFNESEEGGQHEGLGLLEGSVVKFDLSSYKVERTLKIPHMGWNQVSVRNTHSILFHDIPENQFFYFVHSYYVVPEDREIVSGETEYGITFSSAISAGNVHGCQFHPEKSHRFGLAILKNFLERA